MERYVSEHLNYLGRKMLQKITISFPVSRSAAKKNQAYRNSSNSIYPLKTRHESRLLTVVVSGCPGPSHRFGFWPPPRICPSTVSDFYSPDTLHTALLYL